MWNYTSHAVIALLTVKVVSITILLKLLLRLSETEILTIRDENQINQIMVGQTTRGRFLIQSPETEVASLQTSWKS